MKLPNIDRQMLLRFIAALLAMLLALALMVLIPLITHHPPEPERRFTEPRITPSPAPVSTLEPMLIDMPDPNQPDQDAELQSLLEKFIADNPGTWDIYVYNLTQGEYACCSTLENEPMVSASLIKLFIMGAVFQRIQDGSFDYWSYVPSARQMIVISDNYCANWLILSLGESSGDAGMEAVNDFARSIGCNHTSMNRTLLDLKSDQENYTTAEDVALFYKLLYRYELVSPQYSSDMLDILKAQTLNDRIPAGLPKGVICAHKTGDLEHKCCADAGLVFSDGGDYILSVINNGSEDDTQASAAIAELSALVYEYFNPSEHSTESPLESADPTEP